MYCKLQFELMVFPKSIFINMVNDFNISEIYICDNNFLEKIDITELSCDFGKFSSKISDLIGCFPAFQTTLRICPKSFIVRSHDLSEVQKD